MKWYYESANEYNNVENTIPCYLHVENSDIGINGKKSYSIHVYNMCVWMWFVILKPLHLLLSFFVGTFFNCTRAWNVNISKREWKNNMKQHSKNRKLEDWNFQIKIHPSFQYKLNINAINIAVLSPCYYWAHSVEIFILYAAAWE